MSKIPLIDLHPLLQDCKIVVSVGLASSQKCSGVITLVIVGTSLGEPTILKKPVENLGRTMKDVVFDDTPKTGRIHPVIASLVLDSGEARKDDELIKLCSKGE